MKEPSLFVRFLRNPGQIGAVCPSSPGLCRSMVRGAGLAEARVVIELGPGTGVITREILNHSGGHTRVIAVELDRGLCEMLRTRFPNLTVCNESASGLSAIRSREKLPEADAILSGLPWAVFPEELQCEILASVVSNLAPGGVFATFAYIQGVWLPAGRRFRQLLGRYFHRVDRSQVVWRNVPPAFVYRCREPIAR